MFLHVTIYMYVIINKAPNYKFCFTKFGFTISYAYILSNSKSFFIIIAIIILLLLFVKTAISGEKIDHYVFVAFNVKKHK